MNNTSLKELIDNRVTKFINQDNNSSPYLIMTVFGDSIIPHGGEIWLGSLVQILELFDINERLVRTSIFRLTKDTWLESTKIGRKSFYRAKHIEEIQGNEQCLYYQQDKWDGNWRLIVGVSMEKSCNQRDEFRKELTKLGCCPISPNVFAHPTLSIETIKRLLKKYQQEKAYLLMNAKDEENQTLNFLEVENILCKTAKTELEREYTTFIDEYEAIFDRLDEAHELSTKDSFLIKTLMINDYRRLLWHDKIRSGLLMGDDWVGRRARSIAASIYCKVDKKGRQYFRSIGKCSSGELPPIETQYKKRFKHLI